MDFNFQRVLRTKLLPPRTPPRVLPRPRVTSTLEQAYQYRLTVLHAGAGYGKTTALAELAADNTPVIWYQLNEEDSDPLVFLLHLCHAIQLAVPGIQELPTSFLEDWDGARGALPGLEIIDQVLNAFCEASGSSILLVLDDIHLVLDNPEIALILDRMIGHAPDHIHTILSTRTPLQLPGLSRWNARGESLLLGQETLAFTADEIEALFSQRFGYDLTLDEVKVLTDLTEGWAITLHLVWQNLRSGAARTRPSTPFTIEDVLQRESVSVEGLFEILAREVLEQQPEDVQRFLEISATLQVMTPTACDALRGARDSTEMLDYLQRQELFVVDLGDGSLRFQHVFHHFLRQRMDEAERRTWHRKAADYYTASGSYDEAIYHLLKAEDSPAAAELLNIHGSALLAAGRLDTLAAYLDTLPPETLYDHPLLLHFLGDLARLRSRFQEALGWYTQAEELFRERNQLEGISRALRGQSRVYLDTVNPVRAEELLQEALRLSDGTLNREAMARMYDLLAENRLNAGKMDEVERLRQQAREFRQEGPDEAGLVSRVLLRTGRLEEARRQLESLVDTEQREPVLMPRAHRETLLVLSLIYAFQGDAERALETAREGTRRGIELDSPFVTAVGHMRQGHALTLPHDRGKDLRQAREHFEEAVSISRSIAIPRLRVEAFWGLCRVYGFLGDLEKARQSAEEGIEIASRAGDEWIASIIRLTMGNSLVNAGRYQSAGEWLNQALQGFQECSDVFGATAARLWSSLLWFQQTDQERAFQLLQETLTSCDENGYDFLLTRPTLLGLPEERMIVPLLLRARQEEVATTSIQRLLQEMGIPDVTHHPGYQLRIQMLGTFQVLLGDQSLPQNGWRREKTRQLFQYLVTHRHTPHDREQIYEALWPEADLAAAGRNFKAALNTLYKVLEPERQAGDESAFILRKGSAYSLRPGADIWLDIDLFTNLVEQGEETREEDIEMAANLLEKAVDLYRGVYLPDQPYQAWAITARERFSVLFLRAADQLAALYLIQGKYRETVAICERILAQDSCWERAYRQLMTAYHHLGDHGQVARVYQRCVRRLREELDVSPAESTTALHEQLLGDNNI